MKENFARSLAIMRRWEGAWSDHPRDRGGLTRWGISLRFLKLAGIDFNGDGVVDGRDLSAMTEFQAETIYRDHFWIPARCNDLPAGVDLAVFDCAVNQGMTRARRLLQKALRVDADGILGPKTMVAVWAVRPRWLLMEFMARRAVHYSSLAIIVVFGLGWFRRLFSIHAEALQLSE